VGVVLVIIACEVHNMTSRCHGEHKCPGGSAQQVMLSCRPISAGYALYKRQLRCHMLLRAWLFAAKEGM
jgi:hypothetical protein